MGADSLPYLEPTFVIDASAALPDSAGDYRITGRTAAGGELFSLSFTMPETVDGDGSSGFAFALPVRAGWEGSLATITLSGPKGSVTLDGESDIPMAILRDPRTGQVRGILRDPPQATEVAADAVGARASGVLECCSAAGFRALRPGGDERRRPGCQPRRLAPDWSLVGHRVPSGTRGGYGYQSRHDSNSRHSRSIFRLFQYAGARSGSTARNADRAVLYEVGRFLAVIQVTRDPPTRCKTFALWRGVAPPPPSNPPRLPAPLEVAVEASPSHLPAFRLISGLERPILAGAQELGGGTRGRAGPGKPGAAP